MNIRLQDISAPLASPSSRFHKIIIMNGDYYYPQDTIQHDYHEFTLRALGEDTFQKSLWKLQSSHSPKNSFYNFNLQVLEHATKSRNILLVSGDAISILHHCSFTLNENFEIIPLTSSIRAGIIKNIYGFASEGYSVSGIAIKKIESKFRITADFHNGIFIAMTLREYNLFSNHRITTDNKKNNTIVTKIFSKELLPTCKWFARKIGVTASDDFCITSDVLQSMSDAELATQIHHLNIFAQMRPIDLERVSRLYISSGNAIIN